MRRCGLLVRIGVVGGDGLLGAGVFVVELFG